MVIELNEQNFEQEVLNTKGLVLIDFYAIWCGPCKMIHPVIEDLANDNIIKICKCDVDKNRSIAMRYSISSIPTLILFKDGQDKEITHGYMPKERLIKFIEDNKG